PVQPRRYRDQSFAATHKAASILPDSKSFYRSAIRAPSYHAILCRAINRHRLRVRQATRSSANEPAIFDWGKEGVLGDESFVQKLRDRVKGLHKQRREITSLRKAAASIEPDRILQRVAEKYQVDRERLVARGERGLHARNVAMWMIWQTGNKSLREIGELFAGLDYAAVAQRIRRTRSSHDSMAARKLKATMLNV